MTVKDKKTGELKKVTEYYHRGVVAHLVGFDLPVVLDVEMVRPGEGEITAAGRLLERLAAEQGRVFDAVAGDAAYLGGPFCRLCRRLGKHLLAVVKDNNPALLAQIQALTTGAPDLERDEKGERSVRYWDVSEVRSQAIEEPIRAVRVEETWTERKCVAGRRVQEAQRSEWVWGTTIPPELLPMRQIRQVGHERWQIENPIFNALSRDWALDHCFRHDPAAIVNLLLILFMAHLFVACFYRRNMKEPLRRHLTLIAVATQILIGLATLQARDVPWRTDIAPQRSP